uniref:F-box domain-containing protein n=1 Tax=Colletotrichum fructicola (strain Nara gc5) TaxID=1213859 RepID=L2FU06_COLFN
MGHADGASKMLHLNLLPAEILHHIFAGLEPRDLAPHMPLLTHFCEGEPETLQGRLSECADAELDWEKEIHDYVRLSLLCTSSNVDEKTDQLPFVYDTVNRFLKNASSTGEAQNEAGTHAASRNAAFLARAFREEPARLAFLCRSFIFERARSEVRPIRIPEKPKEEHQQSAKLHCLYGRPILNCGRTRSSRVYPYACSKVYDLRQYTPRTKWGPFMDDDTDRVDWEKVEAILIVLGSNIRSQNLTAKVFSNLWERPFVGSWAGSYVPAPNRGIQDLDLKDPYGVAGTWLRVVCFIDYNDFFGYNFPLDDQMPRESPGEQDGKDLPVVHFEGISRSIDDSWDENANSDLRVKGTVRLTKEGEVRWTTFSIFSGHARWRSEGIQIGGVGSARGVVGHWFDTDYDPHGPCGPSAYFKVSDRAPNPKGDDQQISFHDFLPIMDFEADLGSDEDDEDFVVGEWGEDEEDEEMDVENDREALAQDLAALASADAEIIDMLLNGHHVIGE